MSCAFHLGIETFSSAWCPPWVEFAGSFRDGFTSSKRRLFSHPQSLSFPCWTGIEGSPFDEQEDLSSLADSSRSWPCHWPHMYTGRGDGAWPSPALVPPLFSWMCWKEQRHISLPSLQTCFSASSSEEQTCGVYRRVTRGLCLGQCDVRDEFCNFSDPGSPTNLLVSQAGANPHQMLCARHRCILGCPWSSEPAKISMLHARCVLMLLFSYGPAAEPDCAPMTLSQGRALKGVQPIPAQIPAWLSFFHLAWLSLGDLHLGQRCQCSDFVL